MDERVDEHHKAILLVPAGVEKPSSQSPKEKAQKDEWSELPATGKLDPPQRDTDFPELEQEDWIARLRSRVQCMKELAEHKLDLPAQPSLGEGHNPYAFVQHELPGSRTVRYPGRWNQVDDVGFPCRLLSTEPAFYERTDGVAH